MTKMKRTASTAPVCGTRRNHTIRCLLAAQLYYAIVYAPTRTRALVRDLSSIQRSRSLQHRRGGDVSLNAAPSALFPRDYGRSGVLFSNDPFFPALSAESADYYDLAEENHVQALSYLPNSGLDLPPQTHDVLNKVTNNYVFENVEQTRQQPLGPEDVLISIETEYETRNVPVVLDDRTVSIPEKGGKEALKDFTEILSLSALHGIPKEITLELLHTACAETMEPYIKTFELGGWDSVQFPKGLSVRPKKEFRKQETRKGVVTMLRRRKRTKQLAKEAQEAILVARSATAPDKMPIQTREELIAQIEELGDEKPKTKTRDELLFFPNSVPLKNISFKELRRVAKRQYTKLKRKGRAGVLSYFFFNFLFYTIGILWQWPRVPLPDPLTTSSTALMLVVKKCGRVFASLYVAAQILKLPKVLMAIAITPFSQRVLNFVSRKLRVSETVALVSVGAVLFASWIALCGIPILSDFARLKNLVYMDEKLVQVYGMQPV